MSVAGVIPARWGSTRFPGKSLAPILGKPLIQRVAERAREAVSLDRLLVATDDTRIARAAEAAGVEAVMTRSDHPSGTDRMAEALAGTDAEIAVNIQGDEPMIDPALIDRLVETLVSDASWDMATAAAPIVNAAELNDPSVVKVVWDKRGCALYFSRAPIPFARDAGEAMPNEGCYWRHVGVYAYRRTFLDTFVAAEPSALERIEKLEQLRALHLGARIAVVQTRDEGIGVDTPEDARRVERMLMGKD
jgi:3-deoxy-manno-octulosonate cytidylyltransferase (CMP-KDO synthetase)